MEQLSVVITEQDMHRLRGLLAAYRAGAPDNRPVGLENKLDGASVVSPDTVPSDVVTMYSQARIRNLETGHTGEFTLVMPAETDLAAARLSVLAPLGAAAIGYREGDEVRWPMPQGLQRLRIEKLLYQPEAARSRTARAT